MSGLNINTGNYIGKEDDIFKALREVKIGELLPSDGFLGFFYDSVSNPSTVLFLCSKKKAKFFYVDNDEFLYGIMDQTPHWILDIDKNILRINLLFTINGNTIPMGFLFDTSVDAYKNTLKLIAKKGEFDLYFLSLLYGGIVLEKRVKYEIPKSIIKTFKSIK